MNNKLKGVLCIISAAFCFAMMSVFVKLAGDIPSIQKSFFRNFIALLVSLFILIKNKEQLKCQKKKNIPFLFMRAFFGTVGILGNFYAIDHLILSDASMIAKLSPFFVIIFSFIFLKEKVNFVQILSVIVAFIGCLFIIKPSFNLSAIFASLMGLMGAMGAGVAYTTLRYLKNNGEKSSFIIFFFSLFSCVVTVPFIIFNFTPMGLKQILMLIMAGVCASGGQFSVTNAYSFAPAKEISVFDYFQVIFAAIVGFFLFNQLPDIYSIFGYILILSVAIISFLYNNKK